MTVNYNTDLRHLSGLERLRHFEQNESGRSGAANLLGYSVASIEDHEVRLRYAPVSEHLNLFQTVHGGILSALLDTAMGCALMTALEADEGHTIIDLHTKFVRPVTLDGASLIVIGVLEHRGRRLCTMSGRIVDPDGRLCTSASATAMIL